MRCAAVSFRIATNAINIFCLKYVYCYALSNVRVHKHYY